MILNTCGDIDDTKSPTIPAHWLAENLERHFPIIAFSVMPIAAAKGFFDILNSAPYFNAISTSLGETKLPVSFFNEKSLIDFWIGIPKKE